MKLQIQPVGNPEFPRLIIARSDGQVFDGTGFTSDRDRAILYAEGQEVAVQFNALQDAMYRDWAIQDFVVPLHIRVRSAQPFSQAALEEYLERAVAIMIDTDKGDGPTPESVVQLDVTWRNCRPAEETKRP